MYLAQQQPAVAHSRSSINRSGPFALQSNTVQPLPWDESAWRAARHGRRQHVDSCRKQAILIQQCRIFLVTQVAIPILAALVFLLILTCPSTLFNIMRQHRLSCELKATGFLPPTAIQAPIFLHDIRKSPIPGASCCMNI